MEKKSETRNKLMNDNIQEAETNNELMNKEDGDQNGEDLDKKKQKIDNQSHGNVLNQCPPVLQWPYTNTSQPAFKQYPTIPIPSFPSQQTSLVSQMQTFSFTAQQQHNINHSQQGTPPLQQSQPTGSFWLPPVHAFPIRGASTAQPFGHIETPDSSWQTGIHALGGASSRNDSHVPGMFYQGGYSNPMGFPSTWNPSYWWAPSQLPCAYTSLSPGAYTCFPFPPPIVPNALQASGQLLQRGIIHPRENISQKHQQMWAAQSSENVQMWAAIGYLQAEMSSYGSRLMKLEAELKSMKSKVVKLSADARPDPAPIGEALKRGRPKKVSAIDALPSTDKSQPRTHARKAAPNKAQPETKELHSEKQCLDMEKVKTCPPASGNSSGQQQVEGNMFQLFRYDGDITEPSGSNIKMPLDAPFSSTFFNSNIESIHGIQFDQFSQNPALGSKGKDDKLADTKTTLSILSEYAMQGNVQSKCTTYNGTVKHEAHEWASKLLVDECEKHLLDSTPPGFPNNFSAARLGGKLTQDGVS